jgi:uncharacterized protein YegP (UPF0339 family)
MSAKFEIGKSSDGHFYFHLKAANGEIIFNSQQYKAKGSAKDGIDSVKVNAAIDDHFERKMSNSNEPYFTLKAANGETVGCSQMYSSAAAMEKGIESVKANAPTAAVEELE